MKQYLEGIKARRLARNAIAAAVATFAIGGLTACEVTQESPVRFSVTVPQADSVAVTIELTQNFGIGVGGSFDLMGYGTLELVPESPTQHFALIAELNVGAFDRQNWVEFNEVRKLPTGASLPSWFAGPVVDLAVPEANLPEVSWDFYLGTRGHYYLGAAASITALDGANIPALNLDYAFYDKQGRLILGLQFFSPGTDAQGRRHPGGILIGADLTPFLPDSFKRITTTQSESVVADAQVSGKDAARYAVDPSATQRVFKSYLKASRRIPVRTEVVQLKRR